jgi:hypothetical protein
MSSREPHEWVVVGLSFSLTYITHFYYASGCSIFNYRYLLQLVSPLSTPTTNIYNTTTATTTVCTTSSTACAITTTTTITSTANHPTRDYNYYDYCLLQLLLCFYHNPLPPLLLVLVELLVLLVLQ